MSILVIGAGSFGTSLANIAKGNNISVDFLTRQPKLIENNFTYDSFNKNLYAYELILLAVPCQNIRSVCEWIKTYCEENPVNFKQLNIINCAKGIEKITLMLPNQIVSDVLQNLCNYATISGPTFASELEQNIPSFILIASIENDHISHTFINIFKSSYFFINKTTDIKGIELYGALKNVLAIACGISDGLEYGLNTRAAIITFGLNEMYQIGKVFGAKDETFFTISAIGDVILTCTGHLSRNRQYGLSLAQNTEYTKTVEGLHTVQSAHSFCLKHNIHNSLINLVWSCCQQTLSVKTIFDEYVKQFVTN